MANYNLGSIQGEIVIGYNPSGIAAAEKHQDQYTRKTETSGQALDNLGTKAGLAGVVIAGGLGLAVKSAADFEKTLSGVKAVSGATTDQMEQLRKKAMQIGQDTSFSSGQAAMAMEELVKAGISVEDVLAGAADSTVALAAAGEVDLPRAAEIAAAAMNNFNLSAKDMPRIADLIAGAANASAIDVGDFGESLKQAGASASLVGLSFDDLAVAITAMGNAGIKGSDAGTSLKTFLSNLQPSTVKQTALMRELGIVTEDGANKFFDASGKVKSMAEIAGVLEGALKGMTQQQKTATLEMLFGSDAIRAAAIISKEGAAGINELSGQLDKISAADVAKTRLDNFHGSVESLKGTLENTAISIGQILIPMLRKMADQLNAVANWFNNLPGPVKETITQVLAITAASLLFIGGMTKLIKMIASTVGSLWTLIKALGTGGKAVGAFIAKMAAAVAGSTFGTRVGLMFLSAQAAIGRFVTATAAAASSVAKSMGRMVATTTVAAAKVIAQWALMAANAIKRAALMAAAWIAANPLAAIIAAVILLVSFIITHWDQIKAFLIATWNFIKAAAEIVWNAIKAFFIALFESLKVAIELIWHAITSFFSTTWDIIKVIFETALNAIKIIVGTIFDQIKNVIETVFNIIKSIVQGVWNVIKSIIETVLGIIKGIINVFMGIITGDWSRAWNGVKQIFTSIWNGIVGIVRAVWDTIKGIFTAAFNGIKNAVSSAWNGIKNLFTNALNGLKNAVSSAFNGIVSFIGGIPGKILSALGNLGKLLWNAGKALIQGFWDGIVAIWNKMVGWVKSGLETLRGLWPFSPAKWGPFSGRGYVTYSGKAMTQDFAKSILGGMSQVRTATERLMGAAQGTLATPVMLPELGGYAMGGGSTTTTATTTTVNKGLSVGNLRVEIPAKDIAEMQAVSDFFDKVEQQARASRPVRSV